MRSFDDIEDILFDGSAEDLSALASNDDPVSYAYHAESDSFELAVGKRHAKSFGPYKVPNCVRFFGAEHTF